MCPPFPLWEDVRVVPSLGAIMNKAPVNVLANGLGELVHRFLGNASRNRLEGPKGWVGSAVVDISDSFTDRSCCLKFWG